MAWTTYEIGSVTYFEIGSNGSILKTQISSGPAIGDNRAWLPGGVISVEVGDGADIAAWRANGTESSPTKVLAQDHIAQFYGTGFGDSLFIPNTTTPIYSGYDGENVHTVSGTGPYSYSSVDLGAETDVACYAYNSGAAFSTYRLLVKTTDYTLNLGGKTLTLTGGIAENRIVIRRRRDWAGSDPFLGRSGAMVVQALADFTDKSRPATVLFGATTEGETVIRDRAFIKDASVVFTGRGVHEDVSGAAYPDNKNIGNASVKKWKGWQGSVFPDTYTPKATVDYWVSDIDDTSSFNGRTKQALAGVAYRKSTDPNNTGFDLGFKWGTPEAILYKVSGGVRTPIWSSISKPFPSLASIVSTGGGIAAYSDRVAEYSINGDRVEFNIRILMTGLNTLATGDLTIESLPFVSKNVSNEYYALSVWANNLNSGVQNVQAIIINNSSKILLYKFANGTASRLTKADLTATSSFIVSGSYLI